MVNIEEEIQLLEDAATNAVQEFETTIMERKKFEEANALLMEEKAALLKRIEVEQGDLSSYTERQAKVFLPFFSFISLCSFFSFSPQRWPLRRRTWKHRWW